jgi:hypothetical protein
MRLIFRNKEESQGGEVLASIFLILKRRTPLSPLKSLG